MLLSSIPREVLDGAAFVEDSILVAQSNLANTYRALGRFEEALSMRRDVYSGTLRLDGEESRNTLLEANNYAGLLVKLKRFEEASPLLRKWIPVARRLLGEGTDITLSLRSIYARALCSDRGATQPTLADLREGVTTFEDTERIARRVFGGAHPLTKDIEDDLRAARAALRARETPSGSRRGAPK